MKNFKLALIASAVAVSTSSVAIAATNGTMDATSEGTSLVTIVKQNSVQITNVNDLTLGKHYALTADVVAADDVCVFSSTAAYSVTMTSTSGTGASFAMSDGASALMPYSVEWTGNGVVDPAPVLSGTVIGTTFVGDPLSPNCGNGTNASFEVTVTAADFNASINGSYTDTLTLLVSPL